MLKQAISVLHITNADATEAFYWGQLGFQLEFEVPARATKRDPCYMGVSRGGALLYLSGHAGDGVVGGVVYCVCDEVDALHAEFVAKNVRSTSRRWTRPGACVSYMCSIRMETASGSVRRYGLSERRRTPYRPHCGSREPRRIRPPRQPGLRSCGVRIGALRLCPRQAFIAAAFFSSNKERSCVVNSVPTGIGADSQGNRFRLSVRALDFPIVAGLAMARTGKDPGRADAGPATACRLR